MKVEDAGFDRICLWHTGHTEVKGSRYAAPTILQDGKFRDDLEGRYGPDVWVEYINKFIAADHDKPFFVYYPMALPHWPMVPTPDSPEWKDRSTRDREEVRFIKDMVEYMDKCVGRIVGKIDSLGMGDNTLILFYSDNGTHLKVTTETADGPIAGGKGEPTDAGTHVPFIARWPGKIKPSVNNNLVDSTDFLPTLLEAASDPLPGDVATDGISFYRQLIGQKSPVRQWTFCHFDPRPGWDKDRFRLVRYARNRQFKLYDDGRLFDVPNDQLEESPIFLSRDSDASRKARSELADVLKSMKIEK